MYRIQPHLLNDYVREGLAVGLSTAAVLACYLLGGLILS